MENRRSVSRWRRDKNLAGLSRRESSLARPSFHVEAVLASRRMLRRARGTLSLIPRGTGRK